MMQDSLLEFDDNPSLPGFRLTRFEVLNWGTFHREVWRLNADCKNVLVTGDIGSGKSTLVDGLTTLLMASHRITYNLAAGADFRERDLRSYVLGYYKREKDADQAVRPVPLRDEKSYSVLLAEFYNAAFDQLVVLAQVFFTKPGERQPQRFYVIAERTLSIAEDFANFGGEPRQLKSRLKNKDHVQVFDSYTDYASHFRRKLMLRSDQALSLFYQTVSLKSVGNLTAFVREHMLEAENVDERIDQIIRNFDNLNNAHEQVVKAREQIEVLTPLATNSGRYDEETQAVSKREAERDAVSAFIAHGKEALLEAQITENQESCDRAQERVRAILAQLDGLETEQQELQKALWEAGGSRIAEIARAIKHCAGLRDRAKENRRRYDDCCQLLQLLPAVDGETFLDLRKKAADILNRLDQEQQQLAEAQLELQLQLKVQQTAFDELDTDIKALENRPSNIPRHMLELRAGLAGTLNLSDKDLPFTGELVQVRADAEAWEGALERLLHGFALSVLVAEDHYQALSEAVNRAHLGGRLVYYRVRETSVSPLPRLSAQSAMRKLEIRPDSRFQAYLQATLATRFDYLCASNMTDFRRAARAITLQGQIKGSGYRHEKDDRHAIDDRRRFVLGWSNRLKLATLKQDRQHLQDQGFELLRQIEIQGEKLKTLEASRRAIVQLLHFDRFDEVDVMGPASEISRLESERREIEESSDRILTLTEQLDSKKTQVRSARDAIRDKEKKVSAFEERIAQASEQLEQCRELSEGLDEGLIAQLEQCWQAHLPSETLNLRSGDRQGSDLRSQLQAAIDAGRKRIERLAEQMIGAMQKYRNRWPRETEELDASIAAAPDFADVLARLLSDDLPRHEARFSQLLREQTMHDIVLLQNTLDGGEQAIEEAISRINDSLNEVTYDQAANTFIRIQAERTSDAEVRQFRQDLRACTAHSVGGDDDAYSEPRFRQVKELVDRFRGRIGLADQDKRWRSKTCDVRHWFEFSVSERYREDRTEREHYSDSSGKSGGQKEKLAYTILAAALAYQFGLEWNDRPSRSFRFVMIDEAFGRGSDESARYGLELFKRLNLQLLIVTPLQKIHVIEDYVSVVGYIHNEDGQNSVLRQLSISEYKQEQRTRNASG